MPNWQPNWEDVRWDWGAADHAANTLRNAADTLDRMAYDRMGWAREAQAEWRGRFREMFDQNFDGDLRDAHRLGNEMREMADRINRLSRQARAEQDHRECERDRWRREKEEEDRRR